jgi:SAM-dependent methyltransferase
MHATRLNPLTLDTADVVLPEVAPGQKYPTFNGTGYVFFTISPVGEAFLNEEAKPRRHVLEIGAGFGNIAIEALKIGGVGTYTAIDLEADHLKLLVQRVKQAFGEQAPAALSRLQLLCGKAPQELPEADGLYDAILIDKVLHFMIPTEIKQLLAWAKCALKKSGKIYVTTASPYSSLYANLLPVYLQQKAAEIEFPGYFENIMQYISPGHITNYPGFIVPDTAVLFARADLVKLFEDAGMQVEESYSLQIPTDDVPHWPVVADEESNIVGIIAVNV